MDFHRIPGGFPKISHRIFVVVQEFPLGWHSQRAVWNEFCRTKQNTRGLGTVSSRRGTLKTPFGKEFVDITFIRLITFFWELKRHFQERDQKNFQRLCDALRVVGFSQEDMDSIFQAGAWPTRHRYGLPGIPEGVHHGPPFRAAVVSQVLAGLVHLGDLSLAERDEGAAVWAFGSTRNQI